MNHGCRIPDKSDYIDDVISWRQTQPRIQKHVKRRQFSIIFYPCLASLVSTFQGFSVGLGTIQGIPRSDREDIVHRFANTGENEPMLRESCCSRR